MVGVSLGLFARLMVFGIGPRCLQRYPALNSPVKPRDSRAKDEAKVKLDTKKTATVVQGSSAWVALNWKGDKSNATGFRAVASTKAAGVEISYPTNAGGHTSLMKNDVLSSDEIDFTAINVDVPYGTKSFKLDITATWNDGEKDVTKEFRVTVPTVEYTGDDVAISTSDAGSVPTDEPSWVGVDWTGMAPSIGDVQMTATGPSGAAIVYPGERDWTSLYHDNQLDQGETDVARFLLDPSGLEAGAHKFEVTLSYSRGDSPARTSGVVTVHVAG